MKEGEGALWDFLLPPGEEHSAGSLRSISLGPGMKTWTQAKPEVRARLIPECTVNVVVVSY